MQKGTEIQGSDVVLSTGAFDAPAVNLSGPRPSLLDTGWSFAGFDREPSAIVVYRREREGTVLARVSAPGESPKTITTLKDVAQIGPWSPASSSPGFLYVTDSSGEERYQIFYYDLEQRASRPLTDGASRNALPIWSANGESIAFTSNRRNGISSDVYLMPVVDPGDPVMVASRGALIPHDWSRDGSLLAVQDFRSVNASQFYVFNLRRNSAHQLHDEDDRVVAFSKGQFAPSSRGLYLLTDAGGEHMRLDYYKINRRARLHPTRITQYRTFSESPNWDVTDFSLSPDGRWLAWLVNENGFDRLYVRDLDEDTTSAIESITPGLIFGLAFDPGGHHLGFTVNGAHTPDTPMTLELASGQLSTWTEQPAHTNDPPKTIRYPSTSPSSGPRKIPALLYRAQANSPRPVVIWLHGGPESQFRPGFNPRIRYWVDALGINVIAPNVRGSTGYGRAYSRADNGAQRMVAIDDVGALLNWIDGEPELDGKRVCVYGSSYGGFLAMAAMARWPDRLRCGMELAGITDFNAFLSDTSPGRQQLRRSEYGDERRPEMASMFRSLSPMTQASGIKGPVLVAHGLNDSRVPATQSKAFAGALRANGLEVWTVFAADEGHNWLKQNNRDALELSMAAFLERHLLPETTPH